MTLPRDHTLDFPLGRLYQPSRLVLVRLFSTLKLQPFRPLFFGVDLGAFIERVDRMLPDLVRCSSEKNELPDHRGDNHGTRHSRG